MDWNEEDNDEKEEEVKTTLDGIPSYRLVDCVENELASSVVRVLKFTLGRHESNSCFVMHSQ